jgi:hypothetical protein
MYLNVTLPVVLINILENCTDIFSIGTDSGSILCPGLHTILSIIVTSPPVSRVTIMSAMPNRHEICAVPLLVYYYIAP